MKENIIPLVSILLVIVGLLFIIRGSIIHQSRAAERITYEGQVTAVSFDDKSSSIYLRDEQETVEINSAVYLEVGKEYRIIVDGNGRLIDVEIIGE